MNIIDALLQHLQGQQAQQPPPAPADPQGMPVPPPINPALLSAATMPPAAMPVSPTEAGAIHPVVQALTNGGGLLDFIKRKGNARQSALDQAASY